jgi:glyoxylate/hydroxypyruvate reductase A
MALPRTRFGANPGPQSGAEYPGARDGMALLFLSLDDPAEAWRAALCAAIPGLDFRIWPEAGDPAEIDLALVWQPPPGELARYPNLRAILSLGAGVDGLLAQPGLPDVPVARMVDPSLTRTMTEYVLLATLRHHRAFDRFERAQRAARWSFALPPQAGERRVGVMGLGVLGSAVAACLAGHGFRVAGWSREAKQLAGIESFAGRAGLPAFLARTEILICLLPLTRDTAGILDAATFATLPRGAFLINVARGAHLVEPDLIAALESGQLAGATLDVFREEPLPPDHPLWPHPQVLITPHVASYASAHTAAAGVAENIFRARAGRRLLHQVDRLQGY